MKKLSFIFLILLASQLALSQCDKDRHSALQVDNWISCEMSENPNTERGNTHWIMYDFGNTYGLQNTTFWNCNSFGDTESGIQRFVVDYSNDGLSWSEFGEHELSMSEASTFYEGESGPNFEGLAARYILITSLNTFGSDCACLSEIRFETSGIISDVTEVNNLDLSAILAPNPASDLVELRIADVENSFEAEISLRDQTGRLISKLNQSIQKGETNIELTTAGLVSGNYLVKIQSVDGVVTRKLIIVQDHK